MKIKRILAFIMAFVFLTFCAFAEELPDDPGMGILHDEENVTGTEEAAPTDGDLQETQKDEEKIVFSDVPQDSSYAEAVSKLVANGVLNGYEDGTFRPENGITRAEMCKMINLTFGYTDTTDAPGFSDVDEDDWYLPYALAAQKEGYIEGYEDGTFRGSNNITRQEVCVILARLLKLYNLPIDAGITDEVADWAKDAVNSVVVSQFMPLEEGNTFRATEVIKRYEHATVLANFIVEPVKPITANVRFFVNGTQLGETDVIMVGEFATAPENPAPADESLYFDGWRVVGTETMADPATTRVEADVDYEAVFLKKSFDVEFYNGTVLYHTEKVEYGQSPKAPETSPAVDGYEFLGWGNTSTQAVNLDSIKVTDKVVLYAVFKKTSTGGGGGGGTTTYFDVSFYVNGEVYDTQSVLQNRAAKTPKAPFVEGYVFDGWSLSEGGDAVEISGYKITEATDFYAVFFKNPNDSDMLCKLDLGIKQLTAIRMADDPYKTLKNMLLPCMKAVYADAMSGIYVDQNYVTGEDSDYKGDIDDVEDFVKNEMTIGQAEEFKKKLENNIDPDVREFLKEYFLKGIDIDL